MDAGQESFDDYARELRLVYLRKLLEQQHGYKFRASDVPKPGRIEAKTFDDSMSVQSQDLLLSSG